MPRPYDDAPRLPEGQHVEVASLARGDWTEIEIGPGRGWFLVERAEVEPMAALVGLEVRRKWAAVVDARLAKRGPAAPEPRRLRAPRLPAFPRPVVEEASPQAPRDAGPVPRPGRPVARGRRG